MTFLIQKDAGAGAADDDGGDQGDDDGAAVNGSAVVIRPPFCAGPSRNRLVYRKTPQPTATVWSLHCRQHRGQAELKLL